MSRLPRLIGSLLLALAVTSPLAGCGQSLPATAKVKTAAVKAIKQTSPGERTLIVQPEAGSAPIVQAIQGAATSVWLQIYMVTDPAVIQALCDAAARGVEVRVLLEDSPYNPGNPNAALSGNRVLAAELTARGVHVTFTGPQFAYTHAKTMIVDGETAYVLTYNLTKAATETNREFGVINRSPSDVAELKRIFLADWHRDYYRPTDPDLVVSPENARWRILGLMEQAEHELLVGVEVISDPEAVTLLVAKRRAGVDVRVLVGGVNKVPANLPAFRYLAQHGVPVRSQSRPYLHAKYAIADQQTAYLGSINLSTNSLDSNRELGLLLGDADTVRTLRDVWLADWEKADSPEAVEARAAQKEKK